MSKIEWKIPLGKKAPVLLILNTSDGFEDELEWHFYSEYMHGATVGLVPLAMNNGIADITNILKRIEAESNSPSTGIIFLTPQVDAKEEVVIRGNSLVQNPILASGLEVVMEGAAFTYSVEKIDILSPLGKCMENIRFLDVRIKDSLLKAKIISYAVDGVNQSKIATAIATIVTFFSADVDPSLDNK